MVTDSRRDTKRVFLIAPGADIYYKSTSRRTYSLGGVFIGIVIGDSIIQSEESGRIAKLASRFCWEPADKSPWLFVVYWLNRIWQSFVCQLSGKLWRPCLIFGTCLSASITSPPEFVGLFWLALSFRGKKGWSLKNDKEIVTIVAGGYIKKYIKGRWFSKSFDPQNNYLFWTFFSRKTVGAKPYAHWHCWLFRRASRLALPYLWAHPICTLFNWPILCLDVGRRGKRGQ